MKHIIRFYEEDLKNIIIERLDVRPSQVLAVHTTECRGYGMAEHDEPVFYIEVTEDGET